MFGGHKIRGRKTSQGGLSKINRFTEAVVVGMERRGRICGAVRAALPYH